MADDERQTGLAAMIEVDEAALPESPAPPSEILSARLRDLASGDKLARCESCGEPLTVAKPGLVGWEVDTKGYHNGPYNVWRPTAYAREQRAQTERRVSDKSADAADHQALRQGDFGRKSGQRIVDRVNPWEEEYVFPTPYDLYGRPILPLLWECRQCGKVNRVALGDA